MLCSNKELGVDISRIFTVAHYSMRCIGLVNQLLSTLDMCLDYVCIYENANIAILSVPGNADAHYWLICAMQYLGMLEIAKNQLRAAKQGLTEDDYNDVLKHLNMANTA